MYLLSLTSRCWHCIMSATLQVCQGPKKCFCCPNDWHNHQVWQNHAEVSDFFHHAELESSWVKRKSSSCLSTKKARKEIETLLSPSLPVMEVTLSLSLSPPRKHHISKPRQWQPAKCRFSTFSNISWLTHQHNGTPPLRKRFWLPRSIYSQRWRELPFSPLTKLSRSSQDQQQASVHSLQICRVCICGLL